MPEVQDIVELIAGSGISQLLVNPFIPVAIGSEVCFESAPVPDFLQLLANANSRTHGEPVMSFNTEIHIISNFLPYSSYNVE